MKTSQENYQLQKYIEKYIHNDEAKYYAILINAKWGAGKTWFIKEIIAQNTERTHYISLYGVTKIEEIETQIFSLMHPMLFSKHGRLIGNIAKDSLKAAIKIDLSAMAKRSTSSNKDSLPIKFIEKLKKTTIFFDDFERSKLDETELLGYINSLVEHENIGCIIVANTEEINHKDTFKKIKEKTIGMEFEYKPDTTGALQTFIDQIKQTKPRELLSKNKELITSIYKTANYENLRSLRRAVNSFAEIAQHAKTITTDEEILTALLADTIFYSLEIYQGTLTPSEIKGIFSGIQARAIATVGEYKLTDLQIKQRTLYEKYKDNLLMDSIFYESFWIEYFTNGFHNRNIIREIIDGRSKNENRALKSWEIMYNLFDTEPKELEEHFQSFIYDFKQGNYSDPAEILHSTGILLLLKEKNAIKLDFDIVSTAKTSINILKEKNKLPDNYDNLTSEINIDHGIGRGYHSRDSPDFTDVFNYLKSKLIELKNEKLQNRAHEIINTLDCSLSSFSTSLMHSNHSVSEFSSTPILHLMDLNKFIEKFKKAPIRERNYFCHALTRRYPSNIHQSDLAIEAEWVVNFHEKLLNITESTKGTMAGMQYEPLLRRIKQTVDIISPHSGKRPS